MSTRLYRARHVFPVDGPPLEDAGVLIDGERIVAVGRGLTADEAIDLGNAAIVPGLVNAHTHLEFSDLAQPLGRPGMPLPDWIREVIGFRRTAERSADAVALGLAESVAAGTTTLAEIAQPGWPRESFEAAPLDAVVFLELLALGEDRATAKLEDARQHLAATGLGRPVLGLSPHAPYTVRSDLLDAAISLAQQHAAPLAMHLAESAEELELLRTGGGPFRRLLEDLGVWTPGAIACGVRPIDFLKKLAAAPRALVVHGNYLDDEEIAFLARHADRLALVYCPRTHAYFGHPPHPWRKLLARGGTVAIGTDSRASNPDLSVLEELRFLAQQPVSADPAVLLHMGTLGGARAVGIQSEVGSLSAGKLANLTIVPVAQHAVADPHELLFNSRLPPSAVVWRGRYRATASCSSALRTPT